MKKTLVATILGIATVASVMAQGSVKFNNYDAFTYAQITYGSTGGGVQGAGVNSTFTAGLYYSFGTVAWAGGIADPTTGGFTANSIETVINSGSFAGLPGYFGGAVASIPGYTAATGAITFVVVAYNGDDYASSSIRGSSQAFTLSSIATGALPVGSLGAGLQPFAVNAVPEPSTFALAGLGLASLLIFRRRK